MKAIVLEKPQLFRHANLDEPPHPGPGEALVRVHSVGICGSDIGGYLGKMPFFKYPRIPGHELGVEVLEVGSGAVNVRPGQRCAVEPYMNCGQCLARRKGSSNCCAKLDVIGVMIDGGLRERFIIRADKLHPGPALSFDQLALVETLAIGAHAVDRAAPRHGENVVIIGAGPIGMTALQFVKLAGARSILLDVNPTRLDFCAKALQPDEALLATDSVEHDLRRLTNGDGPDVIIDATGNAKSMSAAFGYIAQTGRLVFVGIAPAEVTFRHAAFHRPEGTLLCSRNALPGDFSRIITLIQAGRIDTKPWITHCTTLDKMPEDFPAYTRPETGVIKAVVHLTAAAGDQP